MGKSILAVILGLVVAFALISAVQYISYLVYPLPAGVDLTNPESLKAAMANMPIGALLFVLLSYVLGSLGGGWLASRMAPKSNLVHATIVGAILLIAGIANLMKLPHPVWFWVANLAVYLPAAYFGGKLGAKPA